MARQELHSDSMKIEQRDPISDMSDYEGDVILVDPSIAHKEYADALAFMEEPVQITLEASAEKNAAGAFPCWCNGKPAEVFQNGRWDEIGYLPVGRALIVRRKILEIIIRAKTDTVHTRIIGENSDSPNNVVNRFTSPVHSFSILEDRNPRGAAWAIELRRRNL